MARIMDCWEMGNGLAYIEGLAVSARLLSKAGHHVMFAARDLSHAERVLGRSITYYQAPTTVIPPGVRMPNPMTFADVLINLGFGAPQSIVGRAHAWRNLFDVTRPDLIRCTHAPGALLAARGTGIHVQVLGIGFLVPPDRSPLPLLRTWVKDASLERMAAREQQVLDGMNQGLASIGAPKVESIGALYAGADVRQLYTYPDLDDYGPRQGVDYLGNIQAAQGAEPAWPDVPGKRIFAYLEPVQEILPVLQALAASNQPVLVYLPHAPQGLLQNGVRNMRITDQPLDVVKATARCDFGVSHGGHNIAASFLAAGKPQLSLPKAFPERVTAEKIAALGAGLTSRPDAVSFSAALTQLLDDKSLQAQAQAAAARVAHFSLAGAVKAALGSIDELLAAGPRHWDS